MTNSNTRDSFIFYRSFYEAINHLPEDQQLQIYKAIASYSLDFKDVNLEGIPNAIFTLIKPQLEANRKRYLNGIKEKKISKTEAKQKQTRSKPEANKNVNLNVNGECKLINENKELIESQFEEFWREYKNIHTSKGGKTEALKKFTIALKKDNFQNILLGTKNYIAECKKTETYTKAVSSFLNQEVWKDCLLNNSQSSTEQRTAVLLNNLMKDSLIDKITVSRLNKAKLYTTKERFDKMQNLDQKLREEIKQVLNKELRTSGIEFNY